MADTKEKDEKKPEGGSKKAPKSTASSESQRKLAGLALAVKKGKVDDAEVTSNVRDMAADMSTSDLRSMASKPGGKKKLPDKVTPEKKKDDMKEATHKGIPGTFDYARSTPAERRAAEDRLARDKMQRTHPSYDDDRGEPAETDEATHKGIPGTFDYARSTPAEIDAAERRLAADKMRPTHPSYGDDMGDGGNKFGSADGSEEDESVASGFGQDPEEMEMRGGPEGGSDFYADEPVEAPHNLNFYDIVGKYNEYGEMLHRDRSMQELAQQLSDIAEAAEMHLTSEADDWYDSHTISRNIKEMQGYAKEFAKLAQEADEYNVRMEALYEDMGRVLERYFEIYPQDEGAMENSPQPQMTQTNPLAVTQKKFPHERQAKSFINPHIEEAISARAVIMARSKLRKEDVGKFDRLPIVRKVLASWKILSENANG